MGTVVAVTLLATPPAHAMVINMIWDASITSRANAAQIEAAFNTVAQDYVSQFVSNAQINVNVAWGKVAGQPMPSGAIGAASDSLNGYFTYDQVKSWLTAASANNPSDTALAMAVAHLPATAPPGVGSYAMASAELKALGLISPTRSATDGWIGFANTNFDFDPTNGIAAGAYDFESVAAHEMDEVLGRISGLTSATPTYRTTLDLFRYSAPGVLSFSYTQPAYFSIDGGATNLGNFSNSGGDRADWKNTATSRDIQDAFIYTGQARNLTAGDLTGLDVLGYGGSNIGDTMWNSPQTVAFSLVERVPEPSTLALLTMGSVLMIAGLSLRRRS